MTEKLKFIVSIVPDCYHTKKPLDADVGKIHLVYTPAVCRLLSQLGQFCSSLVSGLGLIASQVLSENTPTVFQTVHLIYRLNMGWRYIFGVKCSTAAPGQQPRKCLAAQPVSGSAQMLRSMKGKEKKKPAHAQGPAYSLVLRWKEER